MAKVRQVRLAGREPGRRGTGTKSRKSETKKAPNEPAEQISNEQLAADNPTAEMPVMVKNGRMAVNYVKPHFEVDKDDDRTVGLELSFALTKEHEKLIPREIMREWEHLRDGNVKSLNLLGIGAQFVELGLVAEGDDRDIEIKAAPIEKVQLAVVEEKGTGEATDVIRLSFRVKAPLDLEVEHFACRHYGKQVWLKMAALQGSLV